jgi:hypothetical protein
MYSLVTCLTGNVSVFNINSIYYLVTYITGNISVFNVNSIY